MWWLGWALAGEPAIEMGAQLGGQVLRLPAVGDTVVGWGASFWSAPRVGAWFGPHAGAEVQLGVSVGGALTRPAKLFALTPTLSLLYDPRGEGAGVRPRPVLRVGLGLDVRRLTDHGFGDAPDPLWTPDYLGLLGGSLVVPVAGALRVRVDLDAQVLVRRPRGEPATPYFGLVLTVGVGTRFRMTADADRDRVVDRLDTCPKQAEDADGFEDEDGCPERDNDRDGVRDELDACDAKAEDMDGDLDEDGCPE